MKNILMFLAIAWLIIGILLIFIKPKTLSGTTDERIDKLLKHLDVNFFITGSMVFLAGALVVKELKA